MRNDIQLSALRISVEEDPKLLDRKIEEFCCTRDTDVERFLKETLSGLKMKVMVEHTCI
jgi:hypothetical protein